MAVKRNWIKSVYSSVDILIKSNLGIEKDFCEESEDETQNTSSNSII